MKINWKPQNKITEQDARKILSSLGIEYSNEGKDSKGFWNTFAGTGKNSAVKIVIENNTHIRHLFGKDTLISSFTSMKFIEFVKSNRHYYED